MEILLIFFTKKKITLYGNPVSFLTLFLLAHTMERSEVVVYNYKYLLARNEIAQRWTSTLCRSEVANDIQPYAFFVSLSR